MQSVANPSSVSAMTPTDTTDLFGIPEWRAIHRETSLVRHLIGSGATAIGRANYADQAGEYYTAFFALSVGLERLAKLILVAEYSISNGGGMPDEALVRRFGHKLGDLMDAVSAAAERSHFETEFQRPRNGIPRKIIASLDAFADANRGRYVNFSSLGNPSLGENEPINKWWSEVAELILAEHYYGKAIQARVERNATLVSNLTSSFTFVRHVSETGNIMDSVREASVRTGQTAIVQKYGRFYALTLVRWLAALYCKASRMAFHSHGVLAFFGSWELLSSYTLDDRFLKNRKVWPLS